MRHVNLLVIKVERDGKVLPHILQNRGGPDLLVGAVKQLPCILWQILTDDGTSLKVELVARKVGRLVPDILYSHCQLCSLHILRQLSHQVLVAKVERPALILQNAEMKCLDAFRSRALLIVILGELKTCTSKALLLHEDALVADGHLEGDSTRHGIESRSRRVLGEEKNLGPSEVVPLDEAWVEGVPATAVLSVKVGQGGIGWNASVKDNGARVARLGVGVEAVAERSGRDHGGNESEECCGTHFE